MGKDFFKKYIKYKKKYLELQGGNQLKIGEIVFYNDLMYMVFLINEKYIVLKQIVDSESEDSIIISLKNNSENIKLLRKLN